MPDALSRYPASQEPQQEHDCASATCTFVDPLPPMAVPIYLASALGLAPHQSMFSSPIALANFKLTLALTTLLQQCKLQLIPQPVNQMNHFFHLRSNR